MFKSKISGKLRTKPSNFGTKGKLFKRVKAHLIPRTIFWISFDLKDVKLESSQNLFFAINRLKTYGKM